MQDFIEDHPVWSTIIGLAGVLAIVFGVGTPVTMNVIGDLRAEAQAEHEQRIAAEEALADEIAENADLIAELTEAQQATEAELQTHMTAYSIFVEFINEKVEANEIEIDDIWDWIEAFDETWADFLEQYELDKSALYTSMSNWYQYLRDNCCGELD